MLGMAQLLATRGNYFPDLTDYPYLIANYPPVFIGLVALGQRLLGPSLAFPRALGLLATLGVILALYAGLRAFSRDRTSAALLASLFALPWFVITWAGLARVDTLAILFSLAGLAIVLRRGVGAHAWPALVCFWLAFFTKQNALLAPAAVGLALLTARDRRLGRALLAYALPLLALFGLLVAATRGQAYRHLVPYTAAAGYEPGRMGASYLQFALVAAPLLVLIVAALALVPRAFASGTGRILLAYFVLNLLALATIAKAGAAQNYFLEPWAATLLLAGFAWSRLVERWPKAAEARLAFLLAAGTVASLAFPSLHRLPQALRRPANAEEFLEATRLVRETQGDVLSENLSLLVVNGRRVLVEPFGVLLLARQGLLPTDRLTRDCEAGRFPLVIAEHRMWQIPGFGECLEGRYRLLAQLGPYQALVPRAKSTRLP